MNTVISSDSEFATLDSLIGYNLKRVYMIFQADFRRTLGKEGLSPRCYSALSLAVQHTDITQSELARELGIERSGLVAIVDELEGLGLLSRVPVPGDRRVQALSPTRKGQKLFAEISRRVSQHEERLLSTLSVEERKGLVSVLKKLRKAYEERE